MNEGIMKSNHTRILGEHRTCTTLVCRFPNSSIVPRGSVTRQVIQRSEHQIVSGRELVRPGYLNLSCIISWIILERV